MILWQKIMPRGFRVCYTTIQSRYFNIIHLILSFGDLTVSVSHSTVGNISNQIICALPLETKQNAICHMFTDVHKGGQPERTHLNRIKQNKMSSEF